MMPIRKHPWRKWARLVWTYEPDLRKSGINWKGPLGPRTFDVLEWA